MITHEDLSWLAKERQGKPCVSILLPTASPVHEIDQDAIRFKNLLRDARQKLAGRGWRKPRLDTFFQPARNLLNDAAFRRNRAEGLAVFISEGEFKWFRTPLKLREDVVLAGRFHITPLLPMLNLEYRFFVLALSQKQARLLDCGPEGVQPLDLPEASKGLKATVSYDAPRKEVQFHSATGDGQSGRRAAIFHGSGGVAEKEKELIKQYFRIVDKDVCKALKNQSAPLVLAGVDYLFPIYRMVNSYSNLIAQGIEGNPDRTRDQELGRQGWELVQPHLRRGFEAHLADYAHLAANGQATTDVQDIVPRALQGLVMRLFVASDARLWGGVDKGGQAYVHDRQQPGDCDLIDLCALRTILHGQPVYAVDRERLPEGKPMAAIFYH